jgi:hypothetical protein
MVLAALRHLFAPGLLAMLRHPPAVPPAVVVLRMLIVLRPVAVRCPHLVFLVMKVVRLAAVAEVVMLMLWVLVLVARVMGLQLVQATLVVSRLAVVMAVVKVIVEMVLPILLMLVLMRVRVQVRVPAST